MVYCVLQYFMDSPVNVPSVCAFRWKKKIQRGTIRPVRRCYNSAFIYASAYECFWIFGTMTRLGAIRCWSLAWRIYDVPICVRYELIKHPLSINSIGDELHTDIKPLAQWRSTCRCCLNTRLFCSQYNMQFGKMWKIFGTWRSPAELPRKWKLCSDLL